jgi:hypothetical protein
MGRRNHNIAVRVEAPLTPRAKRAVSKGAVMNPVVLCLEGLLVLLLGATLFMGHQAGAQLKGPAQLAGGFASAVRDLLTARPPAPRPA